MAQVITDRDKKFVQYLEKEYPEIKFVWDAPRFSYRLKNGVPTVFLGEPQPNFGLLTLHEVGHALSKHKDYILDVERVKIESEAWERAKTVHSELKNKANGCVITDGKDEVPAGDMVFAKNEAKDEALAEILPEWDEDFVQDKLDTYRDWLHTKSRCKKCGLTRYQTNDGEYHCPRCENFT